MALGVRGGEEATALRLAQGGVCQNSSVAQGGVCHGEALRAFFGCLAHPLTGDA